MKALKQVLLLAAALGAVSAMAAKRDLDVERLDAALDRVRADAALAPTEFVGARAALDALGKARGKDERTHLLYLAERSVDVVQATIEMVQSDRRHAELEREHDRILLKAAQRDAELARLEAEKLRLQAMTQEEETTRAKADSEQAGRDLEAALAQVDQAKRVAEAQAEETQLAKKEAQLTKAANESLRAELLNLRARRDERGLVMTLSDYVFDPGAVKLRPDVLKYLDRLIEFVNQDRSKPIRIEGYTDDRGSDKLNQQLSERRAEAVGAALIQRGVDAKRVSAEGRGESNPVASNDTPDGRARNRRVEIIVPE